MSAYQDSIDALTEAVEEWLAVLQDGFQPPELKVGLPSAVGSAAWETTVQYELIKRGHGGG